MAQRKAEKRVTRRKKLRRVHASAEQKKGSRGLTEVWAQMYKPIKKPVTLRLDADVLAWFKKQGGGYQTRINRALRKLMLEGKKVGG